MMNHLLKSNVLLLLVFLLLPPLGTRRIWMANGCGSKTFHLRFQMNAHPSHHYKGIPYLHYWMMLSLNLGIFGPLSAIISVLWIHESHVLRMMWASFVDALILQRIHRIFFSPNLYVFNFLDIPKFLHCVYFRFGSLYFCFGLGCSVNALVIPITV